MRLQLYVSHSFDHAEKHERLVELVRDTGLPVADFSVPVTRQISGGPDEVHAALFEQIRRSNRVLVLVTDGIHRSPYVDFEVAAAKELGKPIIGVYPNGANTAPIPAFLDGAYYRMVGWRGDSLAKALEGEYPPDRRVFELAEIAERRRLLTVVCGATGAISLLVAGATALNFARLRREAAARGIRLVDEGAPAILQSTGMPTLLGALVGCLVFGAFVGTPDAVRTGALLGGVVGLGIGIRKYYSVRTKRLGSLTQMQLLPIT